MMILSAATPNAVVMEGSGWPLGLGNINSRITAAEQPRPRPRHVSSFSSISSSDLDTESTASFFPDQSVQLGRLIGIKQSEKGANNVDEIEVSRRESEGFCSPLLHVIGRIFPRPNHNLLPQ